MPTKPEITGLTVTGGQGQFVATATVTDGDSCLPYMALAGIEFWASATNNRASAALRGTQLATRFVDAGYQSNTTRYWWARSVTAEGEYGDWYPSSATAGVSATTGANVPDADSVGADQVIDGSITANKLDVDTLSAITADIGTVTAGLIQSADGKLLIDLNNKFIRIST